jgi:ubiquinone/menaquinone biosynthesis C-methylase UbiE
MFLILQASYLALEVFELGMMKMNEKEFYEGVYREVQDKGVSGWYINQSHKALERIPVPQDQPSILEVGGNIGEHVKFVGGNFSTYELTDYRDTKFKSTDNRVTFNVANVENLPYEDETFDRVISTCLLHHLSDPIAALREMQRVTKIGGVISILIPCDPGFLYQLAKKVGTNRKWNKSGIESPAYYHYQQHRNHFPALDIFLDKVFENDKIEKSYWPLIFRSWNLNLFTTYQIIKNN